MFYLIIIGAAATRSNTYSPTLTLPDALPIYPRRRGPGPRIDQARVPRGQQGAQCQRGAARTGDGGDPPAWIPAQPVGAAAGWGPVLHDRLPLQQPRAFL